MPEFNIKIDEDHEIIIHHDEHNTIEVNRCDYVTRKLGKVSRTDEGYLRGDAAVARLGILSYLLPDGTTRKELVAPETLFNTDSMQSLFLQPITDRHPPEQLLDKSTVKRRRVGTTGELVKRDEDFLVTSMVITDSDAISSVESGRQQLSPGYKCSLIMQAGMYKGERYDAVQLNRRYNHVAICDRARGGNDLKLNLDSVDVEHLDGFEINEDIPHTDNQPNTKQRKGQKMPQYRIDGIDYESAQEVINHLNKLSTRVDVLEGDIKVATDAKTQIEAKFDEATEKVTTLEKRDVADEIAKGVSARLELQTAAAAVLDAEECKKLDSMSDLEVRKAIILKRSPSAKLDDKEEVYINARFDAVMEGIDFDPDAAARQRKDSGHRMDGDNVDTVEKARLDSEDKIKNSYQNLPEQYTK